MSAPEPPQDEHLTLLSGGTTRRSGRRAELGRESRQRSEFKPGGQQIEVRITGRGRTGGGTLRRQLDRDAARVGPAAESDREESGRVSQSLTHELLEAQPKLRLVGARREIGHTAPLLAQPGKLRDKAVERDGIGMEEQLSPDGPERRRSLGARLRGAVGWYLRRLFEALSDRALLQPRTRLGDAGRSSRRRQRAQPDGMAQQALGVGTELQPERAVEQVGPLGSDAERSAFEARCRAGRAGAQRVTTKQRREFVGGRERVRGLAKRGVDERNDRLFGGSEGRETLRGRHGVNRPMPIDEIRSARGRRGEDRV